MNILVLAPHADDEILGCGGTIARHEADGHTIHVAVLTNASVGAPELFSPGDIAVIRREAVNAHQLLGVKRSEFCELPAPCLDQYPAYKISLEIARLINSCSPTTLYIPHRGDLHKDHRLVFEAALVAARPVPNCPVKNIFAYETLSETEWAPPFGDDSFIPDHFVGIEPYLERKLTAFACFASQQKPFPHPRSPEGIVALARYRGITVGMAAAEAFMTVRTIR